MNILYLFSYIIIPLICSPILIYHKKISDITKLIDYPDERKKHGKPISKIGGIFFLFSIIISIIIYLPSLDERFIISLMLITVGFFFIGLIDDKIETKGSYRLIFQFFIITIAINFDYNLNIQNLLSGIFHTNLIIYNGSIFFTVFCFLSLTNAINLLDGKDGLVGTTFLIFLINILLFTSNDLNFFYLILITSTIIFLFFNIKGKIFLGNSGSYLIGGMMSLITIQNYNISNVPIERIFIMFSLFGLDMLRIYIERIITGKHPFKGDNNHLHHYIFNYYKSKYIALIIYMILLHIPYFIDMFYKNYLILVIISILIYLGSFLFFRKKNLLL